VPKKKEPKEPETKPTKLVHRFTPQGSHRLELHDPLKAPVIGEWATFKGIAILGEYRATSSQHDGVLPSVFRVCNAVANLVIE
jgi:hypothetical protein